MKHLTMLIAAIFLISCGDDRGYYVPYRQDTTNDTSQDTGSDGLDSDSYTQPIGTDSLVSSDSSSNNYQDSNTYTGDTGTQSLQDTESSSETETETETLTDTEEISDSETETHSTDTETGTDSETETESSTEIIDTDTGECITSNDCPDIPNSEVFGIAILHYNCTDNICILKPICPEIDGVIGCKYINSCHGPLIGDPGEIDFTYRCPVTSTICCAI